MNKLILKNVKHSYNDGQNKVDVLKGIDAEFEEGKVYAILGESGCGKTTLISLISALDKLQEGDILFNKESLKKIGIHKFRLSYVNIVFQSYNLIKYMTARENVEIGLAFDGVKKNIKEKSYEVLENVGIDKEKANRLVQKLSGGEQQRVAVARAMTGSTPIIVADEPTGNLDEKTEGIVLDLFKDLAKAGKIVIIVTHSANVAKKTNAIVYKMNNGTLSVS